MRSFAAAVASLVLLAAMDAQGQAPGVLVVSQNKCAMDKQGDIRRMTDSLFIPVAQELVNEGKLIATGSAYHMWGDEWNVVLWYTATDANAFLSAWSDLVSRMNQRHPAMFQQFSSWCSEHRDSMYSPGRVTTPAPATAPSRN